jgi:hypothetical protein
VNTLARCSSAIAATQTLASLLRGEVRGVVSSLGAGAWIASKGIKHVDIETPGAHTWMVWRRNLTEFSSLLFR